MWGLQDRQLATHVLTVHKDGKAPPLETGISPLEPRLLRAYIALAKQHHPTVPEELTGAPHSAKQGRASRAGARVCVRALACMDACVSWRTPIRK